MKKGTVILSGAPLRGAKGAQSKDPARSLENSRDPSPPLRPSFRLRSAQDDKRRRAFTLIEVMVSVLVLAMLTLSLHRFLSANLSALKHSTDANAEKLQMIGFINLMQQLLSDLPPRGAGSGIKGEKHKFGTVSADTLTWIAKPGVGVLTTAASGDYYVKLDLKVIKGSDVQELGVWRWGSDAQEKDASWLPLIRGIASMEIQYFDRQLNSKTIDWRDESRRPSLVYLSITRRAGDPPYEAVLSLPNATSEQ